MSRQPQQLPVLAMALALYLGVGIMSKQLSLMCVGLFYGVLNNRNRKYLIGVVSVRSIIAIIYGFYHMEALYAAVVEIVDASRNMPFTFKRSVGLLDINLPDWAYPIIAIILLIIMIVLIISTLPIVIMQVMSYASTYMVLAIGTPIYYPGLTMWDLLDKIRASDDVTVLTELLRPFIPWTITITSIFYTVGIPTLTFIYLKWIGFYKRIPNSWVSMS